MHMLYKDGLIALRHTLLVDLRVIWKQHVVGTKRLRDTQYI